MAYMDWRAFMPDPNRPRLGQLISGVGDFLIDSYQQRKQQKAREERNARLAAEQRACRADPACDEAALFATHSEEAMASGDLDAAEQLRKFAVERRQQQQHALDVRAEDRLAAQQAADPVAAAVAEYTQEHGRPPDSGMLADIRAAVAQQQGRADLARAVASGEAGPYEVELQRCRQLGGVNCEQEAQAYADALTTRVEKDPPKNKAAALDSCIDSLIVGRGGNPADDKDWSIDDLVTCENMYEAGKRKHKEALDAAYEGPGGSAGAPGTTTADGNPALSKGLRAKLGDLMTDMDVGGWEQGWGRPDDVTNAYHAEAARQLRAGDGRMWANRMPTKAQQKRLTELREQIEAPVVPKANQLEEDAVLEKGQIDAAVRGVYLRMRPGLGPVQQHHLDIIFGTEDGQLPVADVDGSGNVTNEQTNEQAEQANTPDAQFPVQPVDRTGGGLLAAAGRSRVGRFLRSVPALGRSGTRAVGRTQSQAARAQAPQDYGTTPAATSEDATAAAALQTLRGVNRGNQVAGQQAINQRQQIGPPPVAPDLSHLLGGPLVGTGNPVLEMLDRR